MAHARPSRSTRLALLGVADLLAPHQDETAATAAVFKPEARIYIYGASETARGIPADGAIPQSFAARSAQGQVAVLASDERAGCVLVFCVWAAIDGGEAADRMVQHMRDTIDDDDDGEDDSNSRDVRASPERLLNAIVAYMRPRIRSLRLAEPLRCFLEQTIVTAGDSRTVVLDYCKPSWFTQQTMPFSDDEDDDAEPGWLPLEHRTQFWTLDDVRESL
jgi:hypothetical protein